MKRLCGQSPRGCGGTSAALFWSMVTVQKRWGYVGAQPSEYLVCTRRGVVDRKRSGQGMRIFKWPWDSVAIVPTTLQRIEFVADQITRERIGVGVAGIAVFRIAEPMLAFRVMDFMQTDATDRLGATMREMFIGAARRLIANLTLEDCLTRRKEAIAGFLMDEIAPIVGGEGAPDDTTTKGWGVVIDTIEIQQVRITSQQVFAHLQAPYREEIATRAELAELERQRQVAEIAAASARRKLEIERDRVLHSIAIAEEQRRSKAAADVASIEAERARFEAMQRQAMLEVEHARAIEESKQAAQIAHARLQAEIALELRQRESEARDREGALEAIQQRRLAEISQLTAQDRVMEALVTKGLPQIAQALHHTYGTVHVTQLGAGNSNSPLDAVPTAFAQLLSLARSFGLKLDRRRRRRIATRPTATTPGARCRTVGRLTTAALRLTHRDRRRRGLARQQADRRHVLREQRRELDLTARREREVRRGLRRDLLLWLGRPAPHAAVRRRARDRTGPRMQDHVAALEVVDAFVRDLRRDLARARRGCRGHRRSARPSETRGRS